MPQIYGPDYYIRIFVRNAVLDSNEQYSNELVVRNALSVTTTSTTHSGNSFSISLDAQQAFLGIDVNDPLSLINMLEPMDYVEIYMMREPARILDDKGVSTGIMPTDNDGKVAGFGVYDIHNNYKRGFNKDPKAGSKTPLSSSSLFKESFPLTIEERVANPHLVLCGFISEVNLSESYTEGSKSTSLNITGSGLEKFLMVHELLDFPGLGLLGVEAIRQQTMQNLTPVQGVDYLMSFYISTMFGADSLGILGEQAFYARQNEFKKKHLDKTGGVSGTANQYNLSKDVSLTVFIDGKSRKNDRAQLIHRGIPSFRQFFWGYQPNEKSKKGDGLFKWGRLDDSVQSVNKSISDLGTNAPFWDSLQQVGASPFNEVFMDYSGNMVVRPYLRYVNFINDRVDPTNPTSEPITTRPYLTDGTMLEQPPPWVVIDTSDIISISLRKSDAELKTVALSQPVTILFDALVSTNLAGMAPVPKGYLKETINAFLGETRAKTSKGVELAKELSQFGTNNFMGYDITSNAGMVDFWARFGIRISRFTDYYSNGLTEITATAYSHFYANASLYLSGEITVKGDPKYKAGQKLLVKNVAFRAPRMEETATDAHFYITAVENSFTWGEAYVTKLTLQKGEVVGGLSDSRKTVNYLQTQKAFNTLLSGIQPSVTFYPKSNFVPRDLAQKLPIVTQKITPPKYNPSLALGPGTINSGLELAKQTLQRASSDVVDQVGKEISNAVAGTGSLGEMLGLSGFMKNLVSSVQKRVDEIGDDELKAFSLGIGLVAAIANIAGDTKAASDIKVGQSGLATSSQGTTLGSASAEFLIGQRLIQNKDSALIGDGSLINPTGGQLIQRFGPYTALDGTAQVSQGLDIANYLGTSVFAVTDGVVLFSGSLGGYGETVIVDHGGGFTSTYARLASRNLRKNDRVPKGILVGQMGATGDGTGTYLHFELRDGVTAVDPFPYLSLLQNQPQTLPTKGSFSSGGLDISSLYNVSIDKRARVLRVVNTSTKLVVKSYPIACGIQTGQKQDLTDFRSVEGNFYVLKLDKNTWGQKYIDRSSISPYTGTDIGYGYAKILLSQSTRADSNYYVKGKFVGRDLYLRGTDDPVVAGALVALGRCTTGDVILNTKDLKEIVDSGLLQVTTPTSIIAEQV